MLTLKTTLETNIFDGFNDLKLKTIPLGASTIPRKKLHLTCVSEARDFFALEHEWDELFARSGLDHQVFQSYAWLYHWHSVFVEGASQEEAPRLALVIGRVDGQLVMVWPLVERRSAGVRTIEWMGAPVSQYGDVILAQHRDQKRWFEAGLAFIKTQMKPDTLILNKVREDGQFARLSETSNFVRLATQQAPYLDLSHYENFEDFRAAYSKRTRKTRSRKRRRFMEKPAATAEILSECARAGEIALGTLAIKRQWFEGRNVVSRAFISTQFDAFMKRIVTAKNRSVHALVSAFSFDGQLVAGEIGFRHKSTYFSHVAAYDLNHARLSAGVLQFEDTIEHCIKCDIHTIDLLAPADPYKLEWATGTVRVDDVAIPLTAKGYVATVLRSGCVQTFMRKSARLLPDLLRGRIAGLVTKVL